MAGEGRTRLPASACLSRWEGLGAGRGFGLVRRAGSRAGQERGFPGASEGLNQRLRSVCRLFACLAWAGHPRECELGATVPQGECACARRHAWAWAWGEEQVVKRPARCRLGPGLGSARESAH